MWNKCTAHAYLIPTILTDRRLRWPLKEGHFLRRRKKKVRPKSQPYITPLCYDPCEIDPVTAFHGGALFKFHEEKKNLLWIVGIGV